MSKRARSSHREKNNFENQKKETVGFVLCHPMECSLTPITSELPPCLFPICNSPVLLYTLHWLNANGIAKIYIVCSDQHADAIKKIIGQCQKRLLMDSVDILSTSEVINTVGDAIRWIDAWNKNYDTFDDCVIVQGNLVSNVPLAQFVKEHKKRVKNAESAKGQATPVLTTVFTNSAIDGYSLIMNEDNLILHISSPPILPLKLSRQPLKIEPKFFKHSNNIKVLTGLNDSKIFICTSQLLANFNDSDHFDWQNVLNDCVPWISESVIANQSSHAAIAKNCFSVCIDDLPDYISASMAVLRRWLYPVTIEMNFFTPNETNSIFDDNGEEELKDENPFQQRKGDEITSYR